MKEERKVEEEGVLISYKIDEMIRVSYISFFLEILTKYSNLLSVGNCSNLFLDFSQLRRRSWKSKIRKI